MCVCQEMSCQINDSFQVATLSRAPFDLLYNVMEEEPSKSFVVSPVSFLISLATMYPATGFDSATRKELTEYLVGGFKNNKDMVKYANVIHQLKSMHGIEIFNGLFFDQKFTPELTSALIMKKAFLASFKKLNFATHPEEAITIINELIAKQTNSKISNLLDASDINSATKMVLVNTVRFAGKWKSQFSPIFTKMQPFYSTGECSLAQQVPMMHSSGDFLYNDDNELSLLAMSYANTNNTMYVLLPKPNHRLSAVLHQFKTGHKCLWRLIEGATLEEVKVTLPKFHITHELNIKSLLPKLSLGSLSDERTDFTTLSNDNSFRLNAFLQKAIIDVTEEGTEAVEAAANSFGFKSPIRTEFVADRPFAFFIVTNTTFGPQVLFSGVVADFGENKQEEKSLTEEWPLQFPSTPGRRLVPNPL